MITGKISSIIFLLVLFNSCTYKEPEFNITGDKELLKDTHINIEINKEKPAESLFKTVFFNGETRYADNKNASSYEIFISYRDELYGHVYSDNIHQLDAKNAINEIVIYKDSTSVFFAYNSSKEKAFNKSKGIKMLASTLLINKELAELNNKINIRTAEDTAAFTRQLKESFSLIK